MIACTDSGLEQKRKITFLHVYKDREEYATCWELVLAKGSVVTTKSKCSQVYSETFFMNKPSNFQGLQYVSTHLLPQKFNNPGLYLAIPMGLRATNIGNC